LKEVVLQEYEVLVYSKFDWEKEKEKNEESITRLREAVEKWEVTKIFAVATTFLFLICTDETADPRNTENARNVSQYLQEQKQIE